METILSIIISDALLAIVIFFIFFKYNKQLKKNEVVMSDVDIETKRLENDDKQIDLGTKYMENILTMDEKINQLLKSNNWEKYDKDIEEIKTAVKEIKEEQKLQNIFLNGEYAKFKKSFCSQTATTVEEDVPETTTEVKSKPKKKPTKIKEHV